MLISIPVDTNVVTTNVTDVLEVYDPTKTYTDGELVQYDPTGGTDYDRYGIYTDAELEPTSPNHIFIYYSATSPYAPVDGKNYSIAQKYNEITYTVIGSGSFDTLALGFITGDTVSVYFKDLAGNTVFSIIDREINNKLDVDGRHPIQPVTEVLYSPVDMAHGSTVEISIKRDNDIAGIGTILLGLSLNAGFTNLVFTNKFKDFSPTEQDQWGNVEYVDGTKVNIHTGTVDLPIGDYDYMNRTMLAIGGNVVIVNGYGLKHNDVPNNEDGHFYGTVMIGRMKNFSLNTVLTNKRLSESATYKIEIEEIV